MKDIFVYAINVSKLDPGDGHWAELVSLERLRRMEQCKRIEDRRRSLGAEIALNAALGAHCPSHCAPPRYAYLESGKPVLLSDDWYISLAHAGDWAICALSDAHVGVDIEEKERKSPIPVWQWVGVESYLKLTGEGLTGHFRTLCAGEAEIFRLGMRVAYLSRAELHNFWICAASDVPANIVLVECGTDEGRD